MTCEQVEPELVAYHFGLLEGEARERIESHLATCGACVVAFLAIKRAIETSEDSPGPSRAARARLRRAVEQEVAPASPRRRWWETPVAIAVAASVVLAAGATTRAITSGPGSPPHAFSAR